MTALLTEARGIAILSGLFGAVVAVAEVTTRADRLKPEPARKSVHLFGGLGCLLFPLLLNSWISVVILAIFSAALLFGGERSGVLTCLAGVKRKSRGTLYFPLAVLILFVFGQNRLWLYVAGLLVLVLADTAAALAGTRFGSHSYRTGSCETKSLEGTTAFIIVGFLAVYLPLLMLSNLPQLECVLTALLMAMLLGGLEAVSVAGTDNIFVPLATCFMLLKLPTKPAAEVAFQSVSLLGITLLVVKINGQRTLRMRPLILFILVTFAAWSLGSMAWMISVISGFAVYQWLCRPCAPLPDTLTAFELLRPLYAMLTILFMANALLRLGFWLTPFVVATAVSAALLTVHRYRVEVPPVRLGSWRLVAACVLPAALPLLFFVVRQGVTPLQAMLAAVLTCSLAVLVYNRCAPSQISPFAWCYAIPLISGIAAAVIALLQFAGVIPALQPMTWMELFQCQ